MSNDWLQQNSGGSGNPGVAFTKIGDVVVGKLTELPKQVETVHGDRLVCELEAGEGSTACKGKNGTDGQIQPGDEVTLWLKPGAMASAVRDAVQAAGTDGLQQGGTLVVQFSEEKDTGKPQPAKLYKAKYTPATPAVAVGAGLLD